MTQSPERHETTEQLPAILGGRPVRTSSSSDWPVQHLQFTKVLHELAESGDWGRYSADYSHRLNERFRQLFGLEHIHLTSSGTAAVELALRGLNVRPGDEVLLSAYDFKANFTNVTILGAKPVLVDVNPQSCQLNVDLVEAALSSQTKVILASHLHGGVVDMPRLMKIAAARQIAVVEDLCQMPLATIEGRPAGTWGDVCVLSFGGSKLLTAGRGGAVLTGRADILQRIKLYTQRGNEAYPLSEMQAAMLVPQLELLVDQLAVRNAAAAAITGQLIGFQGLRPFQQSSLKFESDFYKVGFWYDSALFSGLERETFCKAMRAEGFPLDPGFNGLHRIHARSRYRLNGELPSADQADQQVVVLHHPVLLEGAALAAGFLAALDKISRHATILRVLPDARC